MKKLLPIFALAALLFGCSPSPGVFTFPSWLKQGQWVEVTTEDWPSYWYFETDGISLQYQDPDYNYISAKKYIWFWPEDTTLNGNDSSFTFSNETYTVTVTNAGTDTIAVDFPALQSLGGGTYEKTAQ